MLKVPKKDFRISKVGKKRIWGGYTNGYGRY